jgi:hypothetical protein
MPITALFLMIVLCVAAFSDSAMAQGASTGGTKDGGSPTMVFPIRPRDEPAAPTAVPNRSHRSPPPVSLRQNYYYRYYRVHR